MLADAIWFKIDFNLSPNPLLQSPRSLAFNLRADCFGVFVFKVQSKRESNVEKVRSEWRRATAVEHFVSACRGSESFVTR